MNINILTSDNQVFNESVTKKLTVGISLSIMLVSIFSILFNVNLHELLSLHSFSSSEFKLYQLFTYIISPYPSISIFIDIVIFGILSYELEKTIGSRNTITYFITSVILSSIAILFVNYGNFFSYATTDFSYIIFSILYLKRDEELFLRIKHIHLLYFMLFVLGMVMYANWRACSIIFEIVNILVAITFSVYLEKITKKANQDEIQE